MSTQTTDLTSVPDDSHILLIPVKGFAQGKHRLKHLFTDGDRYDLTKTLLKNTVLSIQPHQLKIITEDKAVMVWAENEGIDFISVNCTDLNSSITVASNKLLDIGLKRATVVHGDLALPLSNYTFPIIESSKFFKDEIFVVPDRYKDGTNVLSFPLNLNFKFQYGVHSFKKHVKTALDLGANITIIENSPVSFDVDTEADLKYLKDTTYE